MQHALDNGFEIRYTDEHKQFDLISFVLLLVETALLDDRVTVNYELPWVIESARGRDICWNYRISTTGIQTQTCYSFWKFVIS
jgi:hypothetical protein